jgi:hypothetical protein
LDDDGIGHEGICQYESFLINLVGKGAIREVRDKNIQKGKRIVLFHFHSELDMGGMLFRWLKKDVREDWP